MGREAQASIYSSRTAGVLRRRRHRSEALVYARVTDRQRREGFRRMELAADIVKV